MRRLQNRKLKIWSQDFLAHRYMWPNIAEAVAQAISASEAKRPVVVDVGCGHMPYRDLFQECAYHGLDFGMDGTSPDLIASAVQLPLADRSVDIVFCTQVIEHVPRPHALVAEAARILKPGGHLVLTGPFYWPLHEEPFDYFRFTKYGFEALLKEAGFSHWQIKEDGGDMAQLFLSIALNLKGRWLAPLRVIVNCAGVLLNSLVYARTVPANYTILARA